MAYSQITPPSRCGQLATRQAKEEAEQEATLIKQLNSEIQAELEQALQETDQRSTSDREEVRCILCVDKYRTPGCTPATGLVHPSSDAWNQPFPSAREY